MYIIQTTQEFEDYLDGRCLKEGESFTLASIEARGRRQRQREGMAFYSLVFKPGRAKRGYDGGFEVVFWRDHVVSFTDGNQMDHIFYFDEYPERGVNFPLPPEGPGS